jgi:hypothetical protein
MSNFSIRERTGNNEITFRAFYGETELFRLGVEKRGAGLHISDFWQTNNEEELLAFSLGAKEAIGQHHSLPSEAMNRALHWGHEQGCNRLYWPEERTMPQSQWLSLRATLIFAHLDNRIERGGQFKQKPKRVEIAPINEHLRRMAQRHATTRHH